MFKKIIANVIISNIFKKKNYFSHSRNLKKFKDLVSYLLIASCFIIIN